MAKAVKRDKPGAGRTHEHVPPCFSDGEKISEFSTIAILTLLSVTTQLSSKYHVWMARVHDTDK